MATILKRIEIAAPVAAVWEKVSDLGGVHRLMSFLESATVEGDRRVCTTHDGGELRELILGVDAENHRLAYAITDSPFGFEFHSASWQLRASPGGTVLEWFTDLKPDSFAELVSQTIDGELKNIAAALAGGNET